MNTEVNEILKVYLGAGASGGYLPHSHEERMRAAYGEHAISKLELIQKYLNEDHPMTDWTQKDYAKEASAFDLELAKKYPELDQTTLNALACRWSYGWR